ncbi:DUF4260 domain-containing protein [Kaistia geumhonensis]|uniref:DUF4260 family protein n=1 Tax=Kaistia geumhonensis TaxID=410839 RepID=A0ABU0MB56_9HYPH|nr:DUF4260 domain-containing protein [Kaistia geumhonensis]MCX5481116.1 DUF4260 domain-containing protein [Kaistia geumhonensis]MDQ0518176.1 hypothetical protein [Kaistia geumhonensis]
MRQNSTSGAGTTSPVTGMPLLLLRIEGAVMLAAALYAWHLTGGSWLVFGLFFLTPDLAMLGYLAGPRAGAIAYNLVHTYAAAALIGAIGLLASAPMAVAAAVILAGHIGFDRMLGYGLKYPDAFGHTHLGRQGKR